MVARCELSIGIAPAPTAVPLAASARRLSMVTAATRGEVTNRPSIRLHLDAEAGAEPGDDADVKSRVDAGADLGVAVSVMPGG
jgi:hypothetical protein